MSDMVERVARAILASHDWTVDGQPDERPGWDGLPDDWKEVYRANARAAIEAMREPTDAMVAAGSITHGADLDEYFIWRAMIDEALKSNTQYR